VIDPANPNELYLATTVGVFRGQIGTGSTPTAVWAPLDDGLPDGADVTDISLNRAARVLTIGTFGSGAYQREIDAHWPV